MSKIAANSLHIKSPAAQVAIFYKLMHSKSGRANIFNNTWRNNNKKAYWTARVTRLSFFLMTYQMICLPYWHFVGSDWLFDNLCIKFNYLACYVRYITILPSVTSDCSVRYILQNLPSQNFLPHTLRFKPFRPKISTIRLISLKIIRLASLSCVLWY